MVVDASRLDDRLKSTIGDSSWQGRYLAEYCILRLQDRWSWYVREYCLISACGGETLRDGTAVGSSHGFRSEDDALNHLRSHRANASNDWEPDWHVPQQVTGAVRVLGLTNSTRLLSALGVIDNPFDELRACRNFLAHRGPRAFAKFQAVSPSAAPLTYVAQITGAGETRFTGWCRKLQNIAFATL